MLRGVLPVAAGRWRRGVLAGGPSFGLAGRRWQGLGGRQRLARQTDGRRGQAGDPVLMPAAFPPSFNILSPAPRLWEEQHTASLAAVTLWSC